MRLVIVAATALAAGLGIGVVGGNAASAGAGTDKVTNLTVQLSQAKSDLKQAQADSTAKLGEGKSDLAQAKSDLKRAKADLGQVRKAAAVMADLAASNGKRATACASAYALEISGAEKLNDRISDLLRNDYTSALANNDLFLQITRSAIAQGCHQG